MRHIVNLVIASLLLASPAHAAEPLIALDVGLGDLTVNKIPFLMAADNGIYERNGLAVRQFITPGAAELARESGVDVPEEIIRDDIEATPITVGGGAPTIYGAVHEGGVDRVILASLESILSSHVVARPEFTTVESLRGKRFGYSEIGRANHLGALSFARQLGWEAGTDMILIEDASTLSALTENRADAIVAGAVPVALAPEAGLTVLVSLEEYAIAFAGSGVNAERAWLEENRDSASRFMKSAVEAIALLKRDRARFDATVGKWFNITDAAVLDDMYEEATGFPMKPYPAVEGISTIMEIYDTPEMQMHSADDFYDASFIEELDASGYLDGLYR